MEADKKQKWHSRQKPRTYRRFSLRTVLILIALAAIIGVCLLESGRRYSRPVRLATFVQSLGGEAHEVTEAKEDWLSDALQTVGCPPLMCLRKITLRDSPDVDNDDFGTIADADGLHELTVYDTRVTEVGFDRLSRLPKLKKLNLSGPAITDRTITQLTCGEHLQSLYTFGCPIGDEGAKAISGFRSLVSVSLIRSNLTDQGCRSLGKMPQLHYLDLRETAVTDAGIEPLASLTNLKQLDLIGTSVTKEGIAWLQARLPSAGVFGP